MELLIGCPVAHRAWILPRWFDHVEAACTVAGVQPRYVFAVDLNDPCWPIISERAANLTVLPVANTKGDDTRIWNESRYRFMADLRNLVLHAVRDLEPAAFLSLDSDILLHPDHIASMLDGLETYDAVGGKCYLSETGTSVPNWGKMGRENQLLRSDAEGLFPVEILMAAKLMSPYAYWIDYEPHLQGEDIGWSLAAGRAGLKFGWDARMCSKHVFGPHRLDVVDVRLGW